MIRAACLSGIAALALAGGALAQTPVEKALEACGGTRIVLSVPEGTSPEDLQRTQEVINARLGGNITTEYVAPREPTTLVISLPASEVNPEAFAPVLSRGDLGFYTVLPDGAEGLVLADTDAGGDITLDPMPVLTNKDLEQAEASVGYGGQPGVAFSLTPLGADAFGRYTAAHIGERFAIVYQGEVLSAPTIQDAILGGRGLITGAFDTQDAVEMAVILNSGALPVALDITSLEQVDADPQGDQSLCPTLQ